MNRPDQPKTDGDSLDEQLVAYLDGELPAEAQRQLELKLAEDAWSRDRLRHLQQTWDLLDHLPNAQTDRSFTRTTVEMVATKASEDVGAQQRAMERRARLRWVYGGALAAATLAVGYLACWLLWTARVDRQVRDLPVVENLDLYRNAESIDFLRELDSRGLFASDDLAPEIAAAPRRLFVELDDASVRQKARQLTPVEKTQLQRQQARFDRLPLSDPDPKLQDRMRQLNASVSTAEDRDRLFRIMAQYCEWLKSLSPDERSALLALPTQERLARIEKIEREQDAERFRRLAEQTGPEDHPAILDWYKQFYDRHEDAAAERLTPDEAAKWQEAKQRGPQSFRTRFGMIEPYLPKATDEEVQQLADRLSPQAKAVLLATPAPRRDELIERWRWTAFFSSCAPACPTTS